MIVPIYASWLEIVNAYGDTSYEIQEFSYKPIPSRFWAGPNESTWFYTQGEKPRYWIKTPPLAKLIDDEHGHTVLLLSGRKISATTAWVLMSVTRKGSTDFKFVDEPKLKEAVA